MRTLPEPVRTRCAGRLGLGCFQPPACSAAWRSGAALVSRHGSDVVGCAQPSEPPRGVAAGARRRPKIWGGPGHWGCTVAKCKAPPVIEADETDALCTMSSATPPPANHHGLDPQATDPRQDSLIEYPCRFPIKVMGVKADGLVHAVTTLARRFDPGFDAATLELRDS